MTTYTRARETFLLAVLGDLARRFGVFQITPDQIEEAAQARRTLSAEAWVNVLAKRLDLEPLMGRAGHDGVVREAFLNDLPTT